MTKGKGMGGKKGAQTECSAKIKTASRKRGTKKRKREEERRKSRQCSRRHRRPPPPPLLPMTIACTTAAPIHGKPNASMPLAMYLFRLARVPAIINQMMKKLTNVKL